LGAPLLKCAAKVLLFSESPKKIVVFL
jgi:hypothetical protein